MASIDVAKLLNKITQDIPGINTVLKALANWDVSALSDVPDGAMQATTDANNRLTIKKKVSGAYAPVAKLMHDVDKLDGYHASASATANAIPVRNASGALPGNILGNAVTADTATALATGAVVPVNQGGTGATTASQARANLGVADGADFTTHVATQASPSVEGHVKLDALAANGSNTAAPGGFGLGTIAPYITDLDAMVGTCYARANQSTLHIPDNAKYYLVEQIAYNADTLIQIAWSTRLQNKFMRFKAAPGGWSTWTPSPTGITGSTDLVSSTIAASATAVKTAFDRAEQVATASISGGIKVGGAISSVSSDGTVTLSSATTTARGISRVATSDDLVDGATINNGPAFIAAGVNTSVAAAAGKVPVADSNGKVDSWVTQQTQFAACATAAATAAKDAPLSGFSLVKGSRVFVTFANANTVAGALTLNVNSTGAKAIYNELGAVSSSNQALFPAGRAIEFIYDGTNWVYQSVFVNNQKATSALASRATTGTWTITGVTPNVPLEIFLQAVDASNGSAIVSTYGSNSSGLAITHVDTTLGTYGGFNRSSSMFLVPSATSVSLTVSAINGTLYARQ